MIYRYLVSFLDVDPRSGNIAHGSIEWPSDRPISGRDDVNAITAAISRHHDLANPVVMGFSLFTEEA